MFKEEMRYEYDLNEQSVVFDLGCYEGTFANIIYAKYKSKVYAFEPIKRFYDKIPSDKIHLFNYALGKNNRNEMMSLSTDSTGLYAKGEQEKVLVCDVGDFCDRKIDLMKINIEGMEYEVLERIIELGMQNNIKNIQVQFHRIGNDYEERYKKIYDELLKTHELTYNFPFLWQNFKLK